MNVIANGRPLVAGTGQGPLLRLDAPISFWGGVDPKTGRVVDPRHPNHGVEMAGCVVWIPSTIGSSSSSSILLELIRVGVAPAALLLGTTDPILSLGAIVAREMGYGTTPLLECDARTQATLAACLPGTTLTVESTGAILGEPV